jgi:hypothetical protein
LGTNNGVPPVCVMHRNRVGSATQGDQRLKAKIERIAFLQSTLTDVFSNVSFQLGTFPNANS